MSLPDHFITDHSATDTLLFVDDQAILANSESSFLIAVRSLHGICKNYGLRIFTLKTKVMVFQEDDFLWTKIVVENP